MNAWSLDLGIVVVPSWGIAEIKIRFPTDLGGWQVVIGASNVWLQLCGRYEESAFWR